MDDDDVENADARKRPDARQGLRIHLLAYASIIGLFFLIDLLTPGSWWFVWPLLGWGIALAAHWLYVKSVNIDDAWADRRTEDLRLQALDWSHMVEMEKRFAARDSARRLSSRSAPPSNKSS